MRPVLDKGYVKIVASSMPGAALSAFFSAYSVKPTIQLSKVPVLTIDIKCPLFVQLYINDQGLITVPKRPADKNLEAYIPTSADIGSPDIQTNADVANYFTQTTEALLVNQKSFRLDNCDTFVTQILTPISLYNTVVASGSLYNWIRIVTAKGLPRPIEAYREAIHELLIGEWPNINDLIRILT